MSSSPVAQALFSLVIGVVLPILVRLANRWNWSSFGKGVVLALLAAVTGFLTDWQTNPHINLVLAGIYAFAAFLSAVGAHFGVLKHSGVTGPRS